MKYQRAVVPPRTDLRTRRERVAAQVMVRGLDLYERLSSRLLVDVTVRTRIPSTACPRTWTRSARARCSMLGPSRSEGSAV